jgi:hypothetical protein
MEMIVSQTHQPHPVLEKVHRVLLSAQVSKMAQ